MLLVDKLHCKFLQQFPGQTNQHWYDARVVTFHWEAGWVPQNVVTQLAKNTAVSPTCYLHSSQFHVLVTSPFKNHSDMEYRLEAMCFAMKFQSSTCKKDSKNIWPDFICKHPTFFSWPFFWPTHYFFFWGGGGGGFQTKIHGEKTGINPDQNQLLWIWGTGGIDSRMHRLGIELKMSCWGCWPWCGWWRVHKGVTISHVTLKGKPNTMIHHSKLKTC